MDHSSKTKLGSSLKVPSVLELSNQNLSSVPSRYVRVDKDDDHHHPEIVSSLVLDSSSAKEIPVIDLHKLLSGDDTMMNPELEKFHSACKEWGFFQIFNHGVSTLVVENVKKEAKAIFQLSKEEKEKFGQEADHLEGFGQSFVISEDQKLDWADLFYLVTRPPYLRNPRLFPELPVSFRKTFEAYAAEMNSLATKIYALMARALGMDLEDMAILSVEAMQLMRINLYPPCPQPELVLGLGPHSDATGLTILLQVSEVEGLQVRKDGVWVPVIPLPDAFIVNMGDMLEIVTNGIYKSVEHRATVNSDKERISIAAFHVANLEGDLGPSTSLVTPQDPPKFKRISVADYLKGYLSRELAGKSFLDGMRIEI